MAIHKNSHSEPIEHIAVEDDVLVIHVTGKIFNAVGKVEDVDLPEEGIEVEAGEEIASIVGSEGDVQLRTPISGIVLEVNDFFVEEIEKAQDDPEGYQWIVKIEPQNPDDILKFEE